jgi:hypothetical protein
MARQTGTAIWETISLSSLLHEVGRLLLISKLVHRGERGLGPGPENTGGARPGMTRPPPSALSIFISAVCLFQRYHGHGWSIDFFLPEKLAFWGLMYQDFRVKGGFQWISDGNCFGPTFTRHTPPLYRPSQRFFASELFLASALLAIHGYGVNLGFILLLIAWREVHTKLDWLFFPAVDSARRWRRGREEPKKGFVSPSLQAGATCSDRPIRRRHMASLRIIPFLMSKYWLRPGGEKEGNEQMKGLHGVCYRRELGGHSFDMVMMMTTLFHSRR